MIIPPPTGIITTFEPTRMVNKYAPSPIDFKQKNPFGGLKLVEILMVIGYLKLRESLYT